MIQFTVFTLMGLLSGLSTSLLWNNHLYLLIGIEIMTPFRSKGILRHVFDLLKLFNVSSIKLSCESKYLSKYKSLGFKEIDYDAITELYHLELQCS